MNGGWKVDRVTKSKTKDVFYPLHVTGFNRHTGQNFSWSVPDVASDEYDLSDAVIDDDARPFLGRES